MCNGNSTHCPERTTMEMGSGHSGLYVLAFIMVMGPGIVLNIVALGVFGKNLSRSAHLATHLLFSLVCADILASVQTTVFHILMVQGIKTKIVCGWSGYLSTLCPLLCAIVASLMAFDRYLALCKPYFYQAEVRTFHWRVIFLFLSGFSVILCTFPFLGLGEYYHETTPSNITNSTSNNQIQCGVFKRMSKNNINVFGVLYGFTGLLLVAIVLICNCFVVKSALKMKKAVTSMPPPDSQSFIPSEIIFAKVMGVLAVVFLICWTPYMVSIILTSTGVQLIHTNQGIIHVMAGLNYVLDPFVYIFMRRKYRSSVYKLLRSIVPMRRQQTQRSNEQEPVVQSPIPYF